jgi:hypothetical protein
MFLAPLLILFVSGSESMDWWDKISVFSDDPGTILWDPMEEDFGGIEDDISAHESSTEDSSDMASEIPNECQRVVDILAGAEFSIVLKEILRTGAVSSLPEMIQIGGVRGTKDPRYKSLHNAVRMLNKRLKVSLPAVQAMIALRRFPVTESDFDHHYRSFIKTVDPHGSSRCDLMIWYHLVIKPGTEIRDLKVTETTSRDGYTFFQPVGAPLRRMIEFELGRIKGTNSVESAHP